MCAAHAGRRLIATPSKDRLPAAPATQSKAPRDPPAATDSHPATLAVLAAASRDHEIVTFDYTTRQGTSSSRRVEPHSLVPAMSRWYLVATPTPSRRSCWSATGPDLLDEGGHRR
ncbi:WYL domain-containing protein [Streptomyces sp. MS1.HAVA.3]|uniref:WYL domain-containing protein n=1 Tax=Streptomyces caledonius TaxID=3134107 RepID=A0ABU8UDI3_9ACTN